MAYAELTIDQGTTFNASLDLKNDDGTAINVTNYLFQSQIRKSYYSSNPTANLVVSIINAANGAVMLSMNASTTANIKAGRYLYDLKMTNTANVTTRVIEGIVTITPQVSR
jgi:hypothetical protein